MEERENRRERVKRASEDAPTKKRAKTNVLRASRFLIGFQGCKLMPLEREVQEREYCSWSHFTSSRRNYYSCS